MRKIILTIAAMFSITLAYADSCSSGQGSLSYQISGCEEQSRACCSGSWCDWGTTSCANCNDTSAACSVIGSYTGGMASRTVTGSCGSCSYSGWDTSSCSQCGDSQCWNGSSCVEAEATMRNCSGNVSNACAGTQTRTKTCVTGSGWSYGDWSTSGCTMYSYYYDSYSTSETDSKSCKSINSSYCSGTAYRERTGTCYGYDRYCGSSYSGWDDYGCSYSSWSSWDTGSCLESQTCNDTYEERECAGFITFLDRPSCAGTAYRIRTVKSSCGGCTYNSWGKWQTGDCVMSWAQSCTYTSGYSLCITAYQDGPVPNYGNCSPIGSKAYRTRKILTNCGTCVYGDWEWDLSECEANCTRK